MFNHLPPSDYERLVSQSTSSGQRRLNRGNCCTPKFSLPYSSRFIKNHLQMVQDCLRYCTVKPPLKPAETRVLVLSRNLGFQGSNQVSWAYIHCQASTCQVSRLTMPYCTVKSPIWSTVNYKGKMVIWQSKVNFWSTSYFEATIIIWSSLDHDSTSMAQKVSRCKSFYFWTVEKVNCKLTRA